MGAGAEICQLLEHQDVEKGWSRCTGWGSVMLVKTEMPEYTGGRQVEAIDEPIKRTRQKAAILFEVHRPSLVVRIRAQQRVIFNRRKDQCDWVWTNKLQESFLWWLWFFLRNYKVEILVRKRELLLSDVLWYYMGHKGKALTETLQAWIWDT